MKKETIIEEGLLIDYVKGSLSEEDNKRVQEWIEEAEEHQKIIEQVYFINFISERLEAMRKADAEKSLESFWKSVERQNRQDKLRKIYHFFSQTAAVLFIPLFLLSVYLYVKDDINVQYMEVASNPGMVSTVELPDGSKVWLNSKSRLKYPVKFNSRTREVELEGEAFFEVEKDIDHPFIVQVDKSYAVEVLGTSFNVVAFSEEPKIETTLISGQVRLHIDDKSYLLKPEYYSVYDKATRNVHIARTNVDHRISWIDGKLIFRSTPMREVLNVLERNFNVKFEVENEEIYKSVLTARFDKQQLHQILDFLSLASNIEFEIKPSTNKDMEGATLIKVKLKRNK